MKPEELIERLVHSLPPCPRLIRWSCPVLSFGDAMSSRIATVGLNPSNREFVDAAGRELGGTARRFHTLSSLGLDRWLQAERKHARLIWESCAHYFQGHPYNAWFRQLDVLLADTEISYYGKRGRACHLDITPFATSCKWTELAAQQRASLLAGAGTTLADVIRESEIEVLILNGRSVVDRFQESAGVRLATSRMSSWDLRRGASRVPGRAYWGLTKELAGTALGREVAVLGFNHNIQSSFGVTNEVRRSIRQWIGQRARGVSGEAV